MSQLKQQAVDVLKTWVKNVNVGDVDALMSLFADNAILMPTFSTSILDTQSKIRQYFEGLGARPGASVSLQESSISATVVNNEVVALAGKYSFFFDNEAGESVEYPSRFSFFIAPNQSQPIQHQHSSELPD